jgi:hypothetical protein
MPASRRSTWTSGCRSAPRSSPPPRPSPLGPPRSRIRPLSPWPPRLLSGLFAGIVAAYALTRLVALPPLDPDREPLDLLGVCTSALEAAAVLLAIPLGWPHRHRRLPFAASTGGTR